MSTDFGEMMFRSGDVGTFLSQGLLDVRQIATLALAHRDTHVAIQQFREFNTWTHRFSGSGLM